MSKLTAQDIEVVIIGHKRVQLLAALLQSLPLKEGLKITVVINGHDKAMQQLLESSPHINIILIKQSLVPAAARNFAIVHSSAKWILFLDDDVLLPDNYISQALKFLNARPEAIVVGGHDGPYPNCSTWELSLNFTLGSILATAHTRYRHKALAHPGEEKSQESKLTLCNLLINSDVFHKWGLRFDESFIRNEENVLLDKISELTDEIYRSNDLVVYHKRRDRFLQAMKSVFWSGFFRAKSILDRGYISNALFLTPLLALGILMSAIVLGKWYISLVMIALYLIALLLISIRVSLKNQRGDLFLRIFINHIGINLSYALGTLWGFLTN